MKPSRIKKLAVTVGLAATAMGAATFFWSNTGVNDPEETRSPAFESTYKPEEATVELHSHLFMEDSVGVFFRGHVNGRLHAKSWKSRLGSQINRETLDRSGIGIFVIALYAFPVVEPSLRRSIRNQIEDTEKFVHENPNWVIAHNPAEAEKALAAGKRVFVFSLENAHGVLETEADMEEFVDRDGIRIVTFMHLMDNSYGGAAYLADHYPNIFSWASGVFNPKYTDGVRVNPRGLTDKGKEVLQRLLNHGVWIDLSHSSDATHDDLVAILRAAGQPLLYTHTSLRKYYQGERGITGAQAAQVRDSGGIIGVVPSDEMLARTDVKPRFCPPGCQTPCESSVFALAEQYSELAQIMGTSDHLMFGSDFNGNIPHLRPSCGTGTGLDKSGLWNIGQVPEVWRSLKTIGAPVPRSPKSNRDAFLSAWTKAIATSKNP